MATGFRNRILRVNLTEGTIKVDQPGEAFFRKYLGGKTMVAYYLNKEVSGDCDPLGPENKVIIAPSVITGSPVPGTSRFTVGAKSPLTGGFGNSEAGGFFGPELKFAGYDAIVVEGKSPEPVYLSITNEEVKICNAKHLWGKETGPVQEAIREEMGEKNARVLQCGPAGENLVRFANLSNNLKHYNGRGGMGAVFGSKNLRAVAVRGKDKDFMNQADEVMKLTKWFNSNWKDHEGISGFLVDGTYQLVSILSGMGILPTRNFQESVFEHADTIDGSRMNKELRVKREGCYACPVKCKQVVGNKSDDPRKNVDPAYGAPEYETMGSIGSACGIPDMVAVCKGNEMLSRYGMDSIGTGMTIAFAMECFEKGIISTEDTGGLELRFGNTEAYLDIIEMIALRKGFGDVLAEGAYRAAQKIGNGAEAYAMTSKKMEFAAHEPRGKWNVGLGYAVSANGADHVVVEHDHCYMGEPNTDPDALVDGNLFTLFRFGIREPLDPLSLDHDKIRAFVVLQRLWSIMDTLDICIFLVEPSRRMLTLEHISDLVSNITGWDMSLIELIRTSERGIVLSRMFNAKCGITKKDEDLPERVFTPLPDGPIEGTAMDRKAFEHAREMYYHMTGMDGEGKPLEGKLLELEVEEFWSS